MRLVASNYYYGNATLYIPKIEFKISGLLDEIGVNTQIGLYLSSENELTRYILSVVDKFDYLNNYDEKNLLEVFLSYIFNSGLLGIKANDVKDNLNKIFTSRFERLRRNDEMEDRIWNRIDKNEFLSILFKNSYNIYNPSDWSRKIREDA